ncbi:hypothetical protein [Rossellomorea aquimaris]|uniref:hypothetical protein n=1 Tax=Rossellomorea aquimaris TaxID=189382 RepID=UPI001CFCDB94|nr:hypothetical protein [Rossellomorea aquimaris]
MRKIMYMLVVEHESTGPDIMVTVKPDEYEGYHASTNAEVCIRDNDPIIAAHTAYVFTLNKKRPFDD